VTGGVADQRAALAELWRWFGATQCRGYSPIYERIAAAVAQDEEVLGLIAAAPPSAHMPPALFAAVHDVLLAGVEHPLADVYAGRSAADPAPLFLELCRSHRDDVAARLATRHIQTNECGRSAVIGPGLTWLAARLGEPLALVDVGASAGLNLLCDRYRLDYPRHGSTGPASSPVRIRCEVIGGDPPIAPHLPALAARVGIDRSPVRLDDPEDARWLLACVWPDTGRLERTAAAIRLAQEDPPTVVAGDANDTLPGVLATLPAGAVPVVVTTWAFAYLQAEDRARFAATLLRESAHRPLAWLSAEGRGTVELLDNADAPPMPASEAPVPDLLGAVVFEGGRHHADVLGFVHPHGSWLTWCGP